MKGESMKTKMKLIDVIRKASDEDVARIIGSVIAVQTKGITEEEAVKLKYENTLRTLQTEEVEVDYTLTNADRIRSMRDEELAEFLISVETYGYHDQSVSGTLEMFEWLQQKAEE